MKALLNELEDRSTSNNVEALSSALCEASLKAAKAFMERWQDPANLQLEPSPLARKRAQRSKSSEDGTATLRKPRDVDALAVRRYSLEWQKDLKDRSRCS